MELEKINAVINEMEIDTKFKKNQKLLQKITKSNDFTNHLKNMLSTYESEMIEKENIYQNTIKSLESNNVKLVEKNVNLLDDIKLFLTHTEMELEKKNAVIKEMEIDTKIKENQIKTLKESTKLLYKEKTSLEKHIESLKENENLLDNKLSNALSEIEKKQETVKELETMGVQLRAEIQPLEYMKNSLEKKLGSFKKCNKIQSEKIKYLESNNIELLNECIILKEDKKILEDRIDTLVKKEVSDKNYIETLTNTIQEEHYTQQEMLQKITKSNDFINHLKNMLSTYESEVVEKENIYINTIKRFESKNVKLVEENVNLLDDLTLFLTHTEIELEKKNAVIKEMEIDTKIKENQIKTLKEDTKLLYKEKTSLEKHIESLKENENLLHNKLSNALSEIEKKQETVKEIETLGVQLRAEIQPLEYMKNSLKKKLGYSKNCNKIQSEKIKYLESNNIELLNECNILKEDKKILEDRIDILIKNEISDKNYIETLTNTIREEHYTQQEMLQKITKLNDSKNHLKIMHSTYESEMVEKENIYQNIIKSFESKKVKFVEENMNFLDDMTLFLTHTEMELEKKNSVLKEMEICTKFKENQIKALRKVQKNLENRIDTLVKNEISDKNYIETHTNTIKEMVEKVNFYENIIKSFESKNVKLNEENMNLLLETVSQISQIKILEDKIHDFQSKEQKQLESQNLAIGHFKQQLKSAEDVLLEQKTRAEQDNEVFKLKVLELQKQLKQYKQKYHKISEDYETLKLSGIQDTDIKLQIQLEKTEKEVIEWQKKYNDSLFENRNVQNKLESLDAEFQHLQHKMNEMQNKLFLNECEKYKLKSDIKDFTLPEELKQRQSSLIINLEVENAKLTSKVIEYREKYNKLKAYLEEVKSMITSQNIKKVLEDNIDLCKTKKTLQKQVIDLQSYAKELSNKLSEKVNNDFL
ncbi:protein Daple-like isoform X2 [Daktulosphaira vitifoliae]|nr:protein Daple-like isoform X2 [Daktulosphaira vitifoliae]XP_050546935.1 protein Daple-like isoform X2 [Daktulosphaira vitifoliae]